MKRLRLTSVSTSSPRSSFGQASENAPGRRRRPWPIPMCRHVMYTVYYVILRTYNTAWPKMSENVIISMHMCICICIYVFVLYSDDCIIYITVIYSATPNPSTVVALLHVWLPSMGQIQDLGPKIWWIYHKFLPRSMGKCPWYNNDTSLEVSLL